MRKTVKKKKKPEWEESVLKASGCDKANSREFQSKRMQATILEILSLSCLSRPCQLGREIYHIPKDSSSWIWGHHQRNLIAYRCPKTSGCIIHLPVVEELESEAGVMILRHQTMRMHGQVIQKPLFQVQTDRNSLNTLELWGNDSALYWIIML